MDVAFGFFALTPYRPPAIPYLMAGLTVLVLYVLARRLPVDFGAVRRDESQDDRPRTKRRFVCGFVGAIAFFAILWGIPNTGVRPEATMVLLALLAAGVVIGLRYGGAPSRWTPRRQLALASGALGFFIVLAPLQQLDPAHAVERRGMALVGLAMACLLVWLAWRARNAERALAGAASPA